MSISVFLSASSMQHAGKGQSKEELEPAQEAEVQEVAAPSEEVQPLQ